jgi:hypothetical protein
MVAGEKYIKSTVFKRWVAYSSFMYIAEQLITKYNKWLKRARFKQLSEEDITLLVNFLYLFSSESISEYDIKQFKEMLEDGRISRFTSGQD